MAYEHSAANRIQRAETVSPRARARTVQAIAPTTATAVQTRTVFSDGRRRPPPPGGPPSVSGLLTVVDTVAPPCVRRQRPDDAVLWTQGACQALRRPTSRRPGRDPPVIEAGPLQGARGLLQGPAAGPVPSLRGRRTGSFPGGALQGGRGPLSTPRPPGRSRRRAPAWRSARPGSGRCPPRSRKSRTAGTARAARGARTARPRRCAA